MKATLILSKLLYGLGLFLIFFEFGCQDSKVSSVLVTSETFRRLTKIDVHTHYKYPRTYLPELFERWNIKAMLVDVTIEKGDSLVNNFDNYVSHYKKNPASLYLCTSFTAKGIENPDYAEIIISQLEQDIELGARMVKVWKNFGMVTKDSDGNYIQIDDHRLEPIWEFLVEKKITVLAHIADPEQAWRELKDPNNPHYNYYQNNPQYHAYNFPEIPSYEKIISSRDRWVSTHPNLKIIAAHILSMSNNLEAVAKRLDAYPNLSVELGARFGDLAMQDSNKVRYFFEKYQDRILFGTDYGTDQEESQLSLEALDDEEENLEARYQLLFDYLTKRDSIVVRKQKTKGLGLPKKILEKIFSKNFLNLYSRYKHKPQTNTP